MHKNNFFRFISRFMKWMNDRQQEIYFLIMIFFVIIAFVIGVNRYIFYSSQPMFKSPSSILEHFAQPFFIAMFTTVLILLFGIFLSNILTMLPFKRLKLLKMEMEFDSAQINEQQIANKFLYSSTMLHNHPENIKFLLDNKLYTFEHVLKFLVESYKNYSLDYNDELTLEIEVLKPSDLKNSEYKLFEAIKEQEIPTTNNTYVNRLLRGENILLGIANVEESGEQFAIVIRRGYNFPFDTYDQETIESIIGYALILFDSLVMIQILQEKNVFKLSNESSFSD